MTSIIVATDKNGIIGKDNKIPWSCPEDLKHFKDTTLNQTIIMGRKTYDSIGNRPLKNRLNIVISASLNAKFDINCFTDNDGPYVVTNIEEALRLARYRKRGEIFVIGGQSIYDLFLGKDLVEKIYLSIIGTEVKNGDTWFKYDESKWLVQSILQFETFTLKTLIRKGKKSYAPSKRPLSVFSTKI